MSYVFVNIVKDFENLNINITNDINKEVSNKKLINDHSMINNDNHYISLIIVYIDKYGHYHFLRCRNKNIYSYFPEDIYNPDFKFKKNIKEHLSMKYKLTDIKRVSHIENDDKNHIYIVKLNSIISNNLQYETNSLDDFTWHIHFNVYDMNPIILINGEKIIRFMDIKNIL
tara:strand:+ start:1979 stop:2491 length:513 start_codon:yes stop_codon:yes gene_type:complete